MLQPLLSVTKLWKMRWVETVHDQTISRRFSDFSAVNRRLFVNAMTNAARIIAIGDELRDFLVGIGIPAKKVVVGQPLLPRPLERRAVPGQYAPFFANHSPVWMTVGAFIPLYDFLTIAKTFRSIAATEPAAGLVLVAGRFAVDDAYEQEVRSILESLGDRVVFAHDVPNAEVGAMLRASDLLIRGPEHESFGLSRIEALLAGTPVVATDTGETRFMTLYKHGDAESLLLATREASGFGRAGLRAASDYYTRLASQSFDVVRGVYAELGATRGLPSVTR